MAASSLRRWLRRHPQPVRLRVDGKDVAIASGANQWSTTEESIRALGGNRIEALDANGTCLRATTLGTTGAPPSDDDDDDRSSDRGRFRESDLVTMSRLLAESYQSGARQHAEAYEKGFSALLGLVGMVTNRLTALETAWQKSMHATARAQADLLIAQAEASAGGEEGGLGQLLGAFAAGAGGIPMNGAPPASPSNGAPKKGKGS